MFVIEFDFGSKGYLINSTFFPFRGHAGSSTRHLDFGKKILEFAYYTSHCFFIVCLKAGSHYPIFGANYHSNSKKLVMRDNISIC